MRTTVQKLNQWSLWTCHTSPKWATSCHLPLRWLHSSMYLYFFSQQLFNWRQAVRLSVNVDSCVNCWDLVSTWGQHGMKSQTPGWKLCCASSHWRRTSEDQTIPGRSMPWEQPWYVAVRSYLSLERTASMRLLPWYWILQVWVSSFFSFALWTAVFWCFLEFESSFVCHFSLLWLLTSLEVKPTIKIIVQPFDSQGVDGFKDPKRSKGPSFLFLMCTVFPPLKEHQKLHSFSNHHRKPWLLKSNIFYPRIGSFCCVPLAFIFPVLCHLRLCQPRGMNLLLNVAVLLLGMALFVYTSLSALMQFGIR